MNHFVEWLKFYMGKMSAQTLFHIGETCQSSPIMP